MTADNNLNITLNADSLSTLLRSNLSCFMAKTITSELLDEITEQIIESIDYFLNRETIKE
jgi:hypothetical protein